MLARERVMGHTGGVTSGVLTVTSVDPVSGEELASGELAIPGARPLPFRSTRGESVTSRTPALAARIGEQLRALDRERGRPVSARFTITEGSEALGDVEPAALSPSALVRVLVERVRDARLMRTDALGRITPAELEAVGTFTLAAPAPTPLARGLAASPGAAAGRLAIPDDVTSATDDDPRVLVIDDASPEDAAAIKRAVAIVATSGGLTADAAIAARALRKPCVVSAAIRLGERAGSARGDWVTVDGSAGVIHSGRLETTWRPSSAFAAELVAWIAPTPGETPGAALLRARGATTQADRA